MPGIRPTCNCRTGLRDKSEAEAFPELTCILGFFLLICFSYSPILPPPLKEMLNKSIAQESLSNDQSRNPNYYIIPYFFKAGEH